MKKLAAVLLAMLLALCACSAFTEAPDYSGVYETIAIVETVDGVSTEYKLGDMHNGAVLTPGRIVFWLNADGTSRLVVGDGVHSETGSWRVEGENTVVTRIDGEEEDDGKIVFASDGTITRYGDRIMDDGSVIEMMSTLRKCTAAEIYSGVYETIAIVETVDGVSTEYKLGDMHNGAVLTPGRIMFWLNADGTSRLVVGDGVHSETGSWRVEGENTVVTRIDGEEEDDGKIVFGPDGTITRYGDRIMDDGSVIEMMSTLRKCTAAGT